MQVFMAIPLYIQIRVGNMFIFWPLSDSALRWVQLERPSASRFKIQEEA